MRISKYLLILLLPASLFAQSFKVDSSYTIASVIKKFLHNYPYIVPAIAAVPDSVTLYKDIVYKQYTRPDYTKDMKLDLFVPANIKTLLTQKAKLPMMVLIHGGGWSSGNKEMEWYPAIYFAARGYVTAAVEYSLSCNAPYPAAVEDLNDAIKFLTNNYDYVDSDGIILYGESAGGQLASLIGTKYYNNYNVVINVDGVLDMTTPEESNKDYDLKKPSAGAKWLGYTFRKNPDIWKEVSAINYIEKTSPAFLFINSSVPRFHAGRDVVMNKLKRLNIYTDVHTIEGAPHSFWFFHPWIDEELQAIEEFLKVLQVP